MVTATAQNWQETTIGDIAEFFDRQRVPLSGKQRKERQGPYPYYGASGVIDHIDDYIFDGRYLLVAEDGENLNSRKLPVAFFAQGKFWVNNHAHIVRAIPGVADDYFIFAWFAQANISGYITGAAQPKLSQANLKIIALRLPPYHLQRKIAAILSAYDDLIENNNRRIKILEEMAQTIYRELFVNFRFPGYEKVKMVKSKLGMIPEGWEVGTINDVVTIKSGFAFKSKTFVEDGIYGLVTIKNVQEGQFITTCQSRLDDIPGTMPDYCYLSTGDILLSLTGNIGRVCLVHGENYLLNQRVAKLLANFDSNRAFVYFTFRNNDHQKRLEMISTGVAQQNLSPVLMGKLEFVIPKRSILTGYSGICEPIVDEILALNKKNQNLRNARDLLLPKLISGELDVSELDIETEGANQ